MGKKVDFRNPLLGHTQSPEPSVCSNQKQTYVHKTPPHSPCVFTLPGNKPDCYHFYPAVPFNVWLRHWTHWALRAAIHKNKTFFLSLCEISGQSVKHDHNMYSMIDIWAVLLLKLATRINVDRVEQLFEKRTPQIWVYLQDCHPET